MDDLKLPSKSSLLLIDWLFLLVYSKLIRWEMIKIYRIKYYYYSQWSSVQLHNNHYGLFPTTSPGGLLLPHPPPGDAGSLFPHSSPWGSGPLLPHCGTVSLTSSSPELSSSLCCQRCYPPAPAGLSLTSSSANRMLQLILSHTHAGYRLLMIMGKLGISNPYLLLL